MSSCAIQRCRSCGSSDLQEVISLGQMPLANSLLTKEQLHLDEPAFPLDVVFCAQCSLVQITHTVAPEQIFTDYVYFSSYSDTMLHHAQQLAYELLQERDLNSQSLVVEIGSNDGYLLQNFQAAGVPVLGIDPAQNIACVAEKRGVRTLSEFFSRTLSEQLAREGVQADIIIANNVMAHMPDVNGVLEGIRILLKPDGRFIMETPYVKDMIDCLEFDTIYHEHVYYYSITALQNLFLRHNLSIVAIERLPIHGGSLRVTAAPLTADIDTSVVESFIQQELKWGVDQLGVYYEFAVRADEMRTKLRQTLFDLKAAGKTIAAYGASAKGSTLIHYCELDGSILNFIVDRSPVKQGRYSPGTHIEICSPERLIQAMPDYVLLLTWNFAEEILQQQEQYLKLGGHFIIPIPDPVII